MKSKFFFIQPQSYMFFYNEINYVMLGNSLIFIKLKITPSILIQTKNSHLVLSINKLKQKNFHFEMVQLKYNFNLLLKQINLVFFGSAIYFRISGRGYKLFSELNHILFKLGYSHVINFTLPIQYEIQKKEKHQFFYKINGIGIGNIGNILSQLKYLRIPNIYSKKGIFKKNELCIFKEGKKNFTL